MKFTDIKEIVVQESEAMKRGRKIHERIHESLLGAMDGGQKVQFTFKGKVLSEIDASKLKREFLSAWPEVERMYPEKKDECECGGFSKFGYARGNPGHATWCGWSKP